MELSLQEESCYLLYKASSTPFASITNSTQCLPFLFKTLGNHHNHHHHLFILPLSVPMMKDRMERLVAFPFATGCTSAASVAICVQHGRRSKEDIDSSLCRSFGIPKDQKGEEGAPTSSENMLKHSFKFTSLSKPNVSIGLQRLTKSIKTLSQSFVFKDGMEEVQMELEIGLPTNVKHVAHVGFDGSVTSDTNRNGNLNASDFLGFCPISFTELEERLAMCAPLDALHNMENVRPGVIVQGRNKAETSMG